MIMIATLGFQKLGNQDSKRAKRLQACWPLEPKFAGSNPAEAVGFFRESGKSSVCLPSEGK